VMAATKKRRVMQVLRRTKNIQSDRRTGRGQDRIVEGLPRIVKATSPRRQHKRSSCWTSANCWRAPSIGRVRGAAQAVEGRHRQEGRYIVFIDELHTIESGAAEGR